MNLIGTPAKAWASSSASVIAGVVHIYTNLGYENVAAVRTGTLLSASGEVVTNNHLIRGATTINVRDVHNGKTYTATVVGYDIAADVAVIQMKSAADLATVPLASDELAGTSEQLSGLIETNAVLEPGDSGGPLVKASGLVVGMDTAGSESFQFQASESEGFAFPINTAVSIAQKIEAGDFAANVHPAATVFLGVDVENSDYFRFGAYAAGAIIDGTVPASPAEKAGLVQGDVITSINSTSVANTSEFGNALLELTPGTKVTLHWVNPTGLAHRATIKLASGPQQ